jgi:hypothetical protein
MTEHDSTDGGPWPWANWDGDDGTIHRRFRTDRATSGSEAEASGRDDSGSMTLADGGVASTVCPECAAATVSGQGLYWCADCDWSGRR